MCPVFTVSFNHGVDYYGLFHESFSPLPLHVDSGFNENAIIYKQAITPLSPFGETVASASYPGLSVNFFIMFPLVSAS